MRVSHLPFKCNRGGGRFGQGKLVFGLASLLLCLATLELASSALPARVETTQFLPPGTVIPVRLDGTLEVNAAQAQHQIEARVAQEVPLAGKEKISLRSRVLATVTTVSPLSASFGFKPI